MPVSHQSKPYWQSGCGRATIYVGDNIDVMAQIETNQFHAVVTDPPYNLAFDVGQVKGKWDVCGSGSEFQKWFEDRANEILRVARPGAHLLSFGGTRTWHRMTCAVEDAGWEIRDCLMWIYSSGYPKGRDISKDIDKLLGFDREVVDVAKMNNTTKVRPGFTGAAHSGENAGSTRMVDITVPYTEAAVEWNEWNTTLKPAWEPILIARKQPIGSVAQNTLDHGCGGINVGDCRVVSNGQWPANLVHDGTDEQMCRYFYTAKAGLNTDNRPHGRGAATHHPTVKPLDLMQWLVRLVCTPGGVVLDPFMGSGSTGCAAIVEGMLFAGIEQSVEYADIAIGRLKLALDSKPTSETPKLPSSSIHKTITTYTPPPSTGRLRGT